MERYAFVVPVLLMLGGCAETVFNDADEGTTRELRQGSSFAVSLPESGPSAPGEPKIEGALIRYLGRSFDAEGRRGVYRFAADGAGEAIIRIPRPGSLGAPTFVLRVLVTRSVEGPREVPPQAGVGNRPY